MEGGGVGDTERGRGRGGEKESGKGRRGERQLNHPPSLALIRRCCPHLVLSLIHIDCSCVHIALDDVNQLTLWVRM